MRVRPLDVSKGLAESKTKIRSQMQAWHLVCRLFLHVSWPPPRQLASSKALQRSSEDLSNPKTQKFLFEPEMKSDLGPDLSEQLGAERASAVERRALPLEAVLRPILQALRGLSEREVIL